MMLKIALTCFLASILYYVFPHEPKFRCGIQDTIVKQAYLDGYGWLSTGVNNRGYVEQLFIHPDGRYRVIGIDNNFGSCVTESGIDWQFAMPTFPPIK